MKIRITKEQARILENLNNKKVLKITEEQYKEILKLEGIKERLDFPQITNAIGKVSPQAGSQFKRDVSSETRIKGVLHEDLWKEFVNELYGLNESGKNVYEKLIKIMEACGYVENRKLSKTTFEGDKDLAKKVITSGLAKLNECGSAYMAMEAMDEAFKSEKKNPFFKTFVDDWFAKGNENNMVKQYYDNGDYWLAWQIIRRLGDVGKSPQNPQDMEVVSIAEIDGEETPEVTDEVDTITMDVPLFLRALEYSREDAKNDLNLHDITQNAVRLSKEYDTLTMDNYYEIFGDEEKSPESEPNLSEYDDNLPMGAKYMKNAPWNDDEDIRPGYRPKNIEFNILANTGESAIFEKNGELYYFDYGYLDTDDFKEYADVPRMDMGPDEDGMPDYEEGEWEITDETVENYLNDKINSLNAGYGYESLENGAEIVKIDEPMKAEILRIFGDRPEIKKALGSIDEVTAMGGGSPVFGGPGGYPVAPLGYKAKEIHEALNTLKKKVIKENDEMYDYIADELGLTSDEFDEALNNSMAELDIIERIMHSNSYTREEALSIITDILKLDRKPNQLEEVTSTVTAGNYGYDTPGFEKSKFMGTAGKKGKAPVNTKKKTPIWPGGKIVGESATDKTQWAGGAFVEFDDCTKLNNNKEAQKGGCSTGAADNVVKLKKTAGNVNAPSLGKKQ